METPVIVGTVVSDGPRIGTIVRIEDRPFAMDYLVRWGNQDRGMCTAARS